MCQSKDLEILDTFDIKLERKLIDLKAKVLLIYEQLQEKSFTSLILKKTFIL